MITCLHGATAQCLGREQTYGGILATGLQNATSCGSLYGSKVLADT